MYAWEIGQKFGTTHDKITEECRGTQPTRYCGDGDGPVVNEGSYRQIGRGSDDKSVLCQDQVDPHTQHVCAKALTGFNPQAERADP